jgi:hypothetical protein
MQNDQLVATLQGLVRCELADCETAIRDHDPVRALNEVADLGRVLRRLIVSLENGADMPPESN